MDNQPYKVFITVDADILNDDPAYSEYCQVLEAGDDRLALLEHTWINFDTFVLLGFNLTKMVKAGYCIQIRDTPKGYMWVSGQMLHILDVFGIQKRYFGPVVTHV